MSASELTRSILRSHRPSTLARAIAELGRIPKTIHMLNFIDDESYRRRVLVQLNRGEQRHKLARRIYHGQRGEVRKRYREGQEDQLSALGLVVNVIVLWNTLYMNAAVEHLRAQGYDIEPEDLGRLAPSENKTVNAMAMIAPFEHGLIPLGSQWGPRVNRTARTSNIRDQKKPVVTGFLFGRGDTT